MPYVYGYMLEDELTDLEKKYKNNDSSMYK